MSGSASGSHDRAAVALIERYRAPAILLDAPYPPHTVSAGGSVFGGLPTLPAGIEWPRTSSGVPLHFFCQINCAEITWPTALPERGILFFFGRDDAEHLWNEGASPHDDCRVIHAPAASGGEAPADAPVDLPPIGGDFPRSWFKGVAQEGEPPACLHVRWPLRPLAMDSFPDGSGLPERVSRSDRLMSLFARAYRARRRCGFFFPGSSLSQAWPVCRPTSRSGNATTNCSLAPA